MTNKSETVNIKIFEVKGSHCYDCGGDEYAVGISDWQEVTEEEYKLLYRHFNDVSKRGRYDDAPLYQVVRQCDTEETQQFITDIRQYIADIEEKKKQELLKKEQKKQQRLLNKKAKDQEAKIKLYKQLEQELKGQI